MKPYKRTSKSAITLLALGALSVSGPTMMDAQSFSEPYQTSGNPTAREEQNRRERDENITRTEADTLEIVTHDIITGKHQGIDL